MAWIDNLPKDLPGAEKPILALAVVTALAAMTSLARVLYGRHEIGWRYLMASMLMAGAVGMATFALAAMMMPEWMSKWGGYAAVFVGTSAGLFMEELLRRLRCWWEKTPLRSPIGAPIERRSEERKDGENQ